MVWYRQGLAAWTTQRYNGSGVCWTLAKPARRGRGNTRSKGKGSDNCGWIWLWWGSMRRGEAQSSREAGVWGGDKNIVASTTRAHTYMQTWKRTPQNMLTVHSTSTLNSNGIFSNNWVRTRTTLFLLLSWIKKGWAEEDWDVKRKI